MAGGSAGATWGELRWQPPTAASKEQVNKTTV
jgi:hypothetical protein